MTLAGYPDWERVIRSGGDAVTTFANHITATTNLGPFNVQQWAQLMAVMGTPAGSDIYQVNYLWYDTKTLNNLLSSTFQTINASQLMPLSIPVIGPWLVVQIIPKAGGNFAAISYTLFGMSSAPASFDVNTYSGPLFFDTEQLSGNEVITWTLSDIYYGAAIMHFGPDTAAMSYVRIRFLDWSSGAFHELYRWSDVTNTSNLTERISLPAAPIIVDYKNGATTQFITASLMPTN